MLFFGLVIVLGTSFVSLQDDFSPSWHKALHKHFPQRYPDDISGTVSASGGVGTWVMQVNVCHSGEPRQYFGFEFFDHAQPQLGGNIVLPPNRDDVVSVNTPGQGGSDEIHREDCQVWDVDLNRTNGRYNGIWGLQGHVKFDCTFHNPDARLIASLDIRKCH